jgi:hypothetical protein
VSAHRRETLLLRRLRKGIHPRGPDDQTLRHSQEETANTNELNNFVKIKLNQNTDNSIFQNDALFI